MGWGRHVTSRHTASHHHYTKLFLSEPQNRKPLMEYCDFFYREKKRRLFSPKGYFLQLLGQMLPDHPSNDLEKEE